ncbi:MAG: ribosomal RNA small subunit methyltransferase A [Nitrospirae bacterium]|nr:ribosomal RNA small subunit methyltransferase A [Nitrospirota bacterium]
MAKKHLGQNFLFDPSILLNIIRSANLSAADTVLEIGPGPGRLTRLLAERVNKVIAIELDHYLYNKLTEELKGLANVELVLGDALKYPFERLDRFKVVANIPYYITTPIIFRLIEARKSVESMTLTIQKEVAERIVAGPGTKAYGVLSIMVQFRAEPELTFIIPKEAFRPVPKVDSAVIHMKLLKEPAVSVQDEVLFTKVVKTAFSQRRKTLLNSLKAFNNIRDVLVQAGIDPQRRPETLSLAEFAVLSDMLSAADR